MRLSRQAARCRFGPKRRDGRLLRGGYFAEQELLGHWGKKCRGGGMSARKIIFEDWLNEYPPGPTPYIAPGDCELAQKDQWRIQ
eukprot:288216-Pyramimonas_sp.AAC.1